MTQHVSLQRLAALARLPVIAAIAIPLALLWIPASFVGGYVMPSGHDAFYHARRILDAVDAPWRVVQFDPTVLAPEGSWITWPWGYDAFMAAIARIARDAAGIDPMHTLVFVPPAWILVNAALLLGICGQLALPPAATWIVALCFATSPLTQDLHAVGAIDHHFVEYTFVLATLLAALRWLGSDGRAGPAAMLGAVLGLANAVHNGLFVLQAPIVATFAVLWLKRLGPRPRDAACFAAALVASTLLVALPSDAFRDGFRTYQLLSWFHFYAACLTSLAVLLLAREPASLRAALRIGSLLVLATLPLAADVVDGLRFVSTGMYTTTFEMPEMTGPFDHLFTAVGAGYALRTYSAFIFVLPFALALAAWQTVRSRDPRRVLFYVYCLFGGLFLSAQFRFHQFGSIALYVLPLVLLRQCVTQARAQRVALLCAGALALAACLPTWARLRSPPPAGGDLDLALTLPLYRTLARQCHEHPGIVLAENNDGHYIRFFTDCSVITNNQVLSQQSWDKLRQARRLLRLEPTQLLKAAPWVRYVLVRREDNIFEPASREEVARENGELRRALLLPGGSWPSRFELLDEKRARIGNGPEFVLARLFAID